MLIAQLCLPSHPVTNGKPSWVLRMSTNWLPERTYNVAPSSGGFGGRCDSGLADRFPRRSVVMSSTTISKVRSFVLMLLTMIRSNSRIAADAVCVPMLNHNVASPRISTAAAAVVLVRELINHEPPSQPRGDSIVNDGWMASGVSAVLRVFRKRSWSSIASAKIRACSELALIQALNSAC